jgi:GTP cyclohydrolase IA
VDATQQLAFSTMNPNGSKEPLSTFDELEQLMRRWLELIGEDPDREGLRDTPRRVAKAWLGELLTGYDKDAKDLFTVFESDGYDQMIIVKDLDVRSMCEHHCLPFVGKAHIGYIPTDKIVGLSKLARLVDMFSRRLQVQERLTAQIADAMVEHLQPLGAMVVLEAEHTCMSLRGVQQHGSTTVTSAVRGVFLDDSKNSKAEFLAMIK